MKLDLSWGNPTFLQDYKLPQSVIQSEPSNYIFGGTEELKKAIIELHNRYKNAETEGYHIVIGNGATQILQAAINATSDIVSANKPYFSRYPIITKHASKWWTDNPVNDNYTQILTIPNNPTGQIIHTKVNCKNHIYDLSYNWDIYDKAYKFKEDVMVFSLSKATGYAATRIGWALVKDKAVADAMDQFIETSTSGVSLEAQITATNLLYNITPSFIEYGRDKLIDRWNRVRSSYYTFEILNDSGMFMWCKGEVPKELIVMEGDKFGMKEQGYFRINIGCSNDAFNELMEILDDYTSIGRNSNYINL